MIEADDHQTTLNGSASDDAEELRRVCATQPGESAPSPDAPRLIEPLRLQPVLDADEAKTYHVDELLRYHDRAFIESLYAAVCGRRPTDPELAHELADLRGGRLSKVEIITRLLGARGERGTQVRLAGLPSSWGGRVSRIPALGYLLRLLRGLMRLPVLMQHQQQFETYALAQQQHIADYINAALPLVSRTPGDSPAADSSPVGGWSELINDATATVTLLAGALVEHSNHYARFQTETHLLQTQTQVQIEQMQAALAELTAALIAQQQLAEEMQRTQQANAALQRHEQSAAHEAQQEFLIQEQRVIVETQKVALDELREELRELSARQESAPAEFAAEVNRLRSLLAPAAPPTVVEK